MPDCLTVSCRGPFILCASSAVGLHIEYLCRGPTSRIAPDTVQAVQVGMPGFWACKLCTGAMVYVRNAVL